jgi:hypothetical protein
MIKYFILEKLYAEDGKGPYQSYANDTLGGSQHVKTVKKKEYDDIGKYRDTHDLCQIVGGKHLLKVLVQRESMACDKKEDEECHHRHNQSGGYSGHGIVKALFGPHVRISF